MNVSFENKVALVTGAASGMGLTTARAFAEAGAAVALSDPSVGDIAFYAPWGNLAIFYRDAKYASGLIILGKIDGDAAAFNAPGSLKVTIEQVK
jgi:hypothetical protein